LVRRKGLIFAIALALVLGVVGTWEWKRIRDASIIQRCVFTGASATYELSPEQAANASTIAAVAIRRGLPKRATTVALAAALQESKLVSLNYGDRDSVGLFQQRPSQGWGPRASLIDPVYASNKFFTALIRNSDWQRLSIADAAQAVQRSADGSAYAGWEPQARVMSETLNSNPYALTCYLHRYSTPTDSLSARKGAIMSDLKHVFGITNSLQMQTQGLTIDASGTKNGQLAAWLISHADQYGIASVQAIQHSWTRREWQKNSYSLSQIVVHFL
jgi:hypothetical protein